MDINEMTLTGEVIWLSEIVTGEGKHGPWRMRQVAIKYKSGQYENIAGLYVWDKNIHAVKVGDLVCFKISIQAKFKDGRYYNDITAYSIEKINQINN